MRPELSSPLPHAGTLRLQPAYELDSRGRWLLIRRFATPEEVGVLYTKIVRHFARGELQPNPSGPHRFFAKVDSAPHIFVDSLLTDLTLRCGRLLGMCNMPADCALGRTFSLIQPGGFIHRHRDAYHAGQPGHRPGSDHLRANIVVSSF